MSEILKDPQRIKAIAEEIFTPERVDFTLQSSSPKDNPQVFVLTIHFPEVELTNSKRHKRTLKDLFVRFSAKIHFRSSGYKVEVTPTGTRTTYELKEAQSNFTHSHLHVSYAMRGFTQFCLGASNFQMIVENLKLNGTEEDWELMLLSLANYVSWESLEGGPYTYMSEVKYTDIRARVQRVSPQELEQELARLVRHIPAHCWEFTPHLGPITGHPDLLDFFNTYSRIRKMITGSEGISPSMLTEWERTLSGMRSTPLTFRGRDIPIKVYDPSVTPEASLVAANTIDPEVVTWYLNHLKQQSLTFQKQFQYESIKRLRQPALRALNPFQQAHVGHRS